MLKRAAEKLEEDKELERFANPKVGRPAIDEIQPGVIDFLKKIVESNLAGTDSRRRCEIIRTVRTLDDLKSKVEDEGYIISRSGLYYQLLPKNPNSIEGRRHHSLLKVRLLRAENNLRAIHPDRDYCFQLPLMIQDLVKLFGKQACLYMSVDDKARVPIGLTAANKQSPLMMHVDYKVRLQDHDFVKGSGHKLIPSVYAICEITEDGTVSHKGPMTIRIRSGKHDGSSAQSHHKDFERIMDANPNIRSPSC